MNEKLAALERIYSIYDEFAATLNLACEKSCTHCCSMNVTLTTLEGYKIVDQLIADEKFDILDQFKDPGGTKRFRPLITTNRLAELYAADARVPEEESPVEGESCCLLENCLCQIYGLRPFGCRCFVSRQKCAATGYADIDAFTASVNTVFLQVIEHLDAGGCTGNLIDVLQVMRSEQNRRAYIENELQCEKRGLIVNWPLKVLMIPPEHRTRIEPILRQLRAINL